jgi:hypothetical protein
VTFILLFTLENPLLRTDHESMAARPKSTENKNTLFICQSIKFIIKPSYPVSEEVMDILHFLFP